MEILCGKGNSVREGTRWPRGGGELWAENSLCTGPHVGVRLACFRNIKEASVWSEWNEKVSYRK